MFFNDQQVSLKQNKFALELRERKFYKAVLVGHFTHAASTLQQAI